MLIKIRRAPRSLNGRATANSRSGGSRCAPRRTCQAGAPTATSSRGRSRTRGHSRRPLRWRAAGQIDGSRSRRSARGFGVMGRASRADDRDGVADVTKRLGLLPHPAIERNRKVLDQYQRSPGQPADQRAIGSRSFVRRRCEEGGGRGLRWYPDGARRTGTQTARRRRHRGQRDRRVDLRRLNSRIGPFAPDDGRRPADRHRDHARDGRSPRPRSLARLPAAPCLRTFSTAVKHAELVGRVVVSPPVLERVASLCGVPRSEVSGLARTTADVPLAFIEPDSERRASEIISSRSPYRLEVQGRPLMRRSVRRLTLRRRRRPGPSASPRASSPRRTPTCGTSRRARGRRSAWSACARSETSTASSPTAAPARDRRAHLPRRLRAGRDRALRPDRVARPPSGCRSRGRALRSGGPRQRVGHRTDPGPLDRLRSRLGSDYGADDRWPRTDASCRGPSPGSSP